MDLLLFCFYSSLYIFPRRLFLQMDEMVPIHYRKQKIIKSDPEYVYIQQCFLLVVEV